MPLDRHETAAVVRRRVTEKVGPLWSTLLRAGDRSSLCRSCQRAGLQTPYVSGPVELCPCAASPEWSQLAGRVRTPLHIAAQRPKLSRSLPISSAPRVLPSIRSSPASAVPEGEIGRASCRERV